MPALRLHLQWLASEDEDVGFVFLYLFLDAVYLLKQEWTLHHPSSLLLFYDLFVDEDLMLEAVSFLEQTDIVLYFTIDLFILL